ncbi:MAG: lycopene cyclase domain-containing protein [Paenarthrobacter ureafaciens]|uniref:lycopene cyclase domain-containing protein n=1 Tax=Paenarthrobacter ureafaciens TaxID=37931 RepID=UPI001AD4F4EC|nr:lycopene cyclase domain-containing protein [Paenarthrobacter ureafaciens]MBN9130249.1 lycopene cyclase domain-containing protein [Paenarthrobacter ureafaciens]
MGVIYLASLLAGIVCMLLLDHRFRLFFWHDAKAATVVTAVGLGFFLAWDVAGIGLGIFLRGESAIATGILLAPELPLEEPVFLLFLILCTMVLFTGAREVLARAADRKRKGGASASARASHGKPARERENA